MCCMRQSKFSAFPFLFIPRKIKHSHLNPVSNYGLFVILIPLRTFRKKRSEFLQRITEFSYNSYSTVLHYDKNLSLWDQHILCVSKFQLLNQFTDFHKMLFESYTIWRHPNPLHSSLLQAVITASEPRTLWGGSELAPLAVRAWNGERDYIFKDIQLCFSMKKNKKKNETATDWNLYEEK
jgi:hypothetical protein